jgi:hypothetical protein
MVKLKKKIYRLLPNVKEKEIEGACLNWKGTKFKERGKKKINGHQQQAGWIFGTHASPSCKGVRDLSNIVTEGGVWWPDDPSHDTHLLARTWHTLARFFLIFRIIKIQKYP